MKISIDDVTIKVCYNCFNKIGKELNITNPAFYKGRKIVIAADFECEVHQKSNDIEIDIRDEFRKN